MDKKQNIMLKMLYILLVIAAAMLFVTSALKRVELNSVWYVTIMEAISFVGLVWTAIASVNYMIAPEKMTRYDYNTSSGSIKKASMCAAVAFALTAVSAVVYIAVHRTGDGASISCAVKYFIGAVCLIAVNRTENSVKYEKFASEMSGKVNGTEIQ